MIEHIESIQSIFYRKLKNQNTVNEEINIEQQLQTELTRLKKAVDYIEQAEKTAQQVQQLKNEYQSKYEEFVKTNESFKKDLISQISDLSKKNKKIVNNLNKVSKNIAGQKEIIEQNQKEIERLKNLKWYQKLFG